jgi:TonB family protein
MAGGALVIIGAISAFIIFGHPKSAASPAAQSAGMQLASTTTFGQDLLHGSTGAKHRSSKKPAPKASPGATPTAAPSPTPGATPTPVVPTGVSPAEIAKARHQAALHLAALRRQQAVAQAAAANGLTNSTTNGGASNLLASQPVDQPSPAIATSAPTPEPATPDANPTPIYAPRVVVDARFIDRVAPAYPDIAREQGAAGPAIVLVTVGPGGNVISVDIDQSAGNKMLDASALAAAHASRFEPPEIDGRPATETYRIVYTFDPSM